MDWLSWYEEQAQALEWHLRVFLCSVAARDVDGHHASLGPSKAVELSLGQEMNN
jgi:hypothetical protein